MLVSGVLLFFCSYPCAAQDFRIQRSHSIQGNRAQALVNEAPDSLTILAVMVSFQADDNRFTSGDGTFETNSIPYLDEETVTIDPLPHNRSYFEAHLEFAKNYFHKVSGNKMSVEYRILPDVYQMDNKMEFYSPTGERFTNEKLALFARDVWQEVENNGGFNTDNLDPQKTAFVIFHAGVGRDIQLTGTTLDITPQDIPSLSLDYEALSELLGDPSFNGFPINGGAFNITNTLILPRTLSRRGESITGQEFVLQLSTNGLICASIGSYLGLPDLFNTETGTSGIGRFGLMDGESFFSYRGLFPPEPSAWEKKELGWQSPFRISREDLEVQLPAGSWHQPGSIAQYNLSSDEYFLVENRQRDPENDGATITIQQTDGSTISRTFTNNDQAFTNQGEGFEDLFPPGVVTDVDNFDWSLPGGLDIGSDREAGTSDDRFLNGGILIWHIDEGIIRREINDQTVNANPDLRGVDLEEADGPQDIGEAATDNFITQSRGWAFDFWWQGNNASVITLQNDTLSLYQNRFADDTTPSNKSNSGASGYFEFYDFSDNLPTASFKIRTVSGRFVNPIALTDEAVPGQSVFTDKEESYRSAYPLSLSLYTAHADTFLIVPSLSSVYALPLNNENTDYFDFGKPHPQQPYVGNELILAGIPTAPESSININAWNWDGTAWQVSWQATAPANKGFLSSTDDDTLLIDLTDKRFLIANGEIIPDLPSPRQTSIALSGQSSLLQPGSISITGTRFSEAVNTTDERIYTGAIQLDPTTNAFYLLSKTAFSIIDADASLPLSTIASSSSLGWPALVDYNKDQQTDILYVDHDSGELIGKHNSGAMLDFFPISPPSGARFMGTPLIADIDDDESLDLIITAQDSVSMNLYAYNQEGEIKEEFPLLVGSIVGSGHQPVHPAIFNQKLYAVSHAGEVRVWDLPAVSDVVWRTRYGNELYNKMTGRISASELPQRPSAILVDEETYNWPNPASDITHIRYQLQRTGSVAIKIITLGGQVIYNESFDSTGGVPEEQQLNTSGWGNGIYLAMITATVDGQKEKKMIKIAVVH